MLPAFLEPLKMPFARSLLAMPVSFLVIFAKREKPPGSPCRGHPKYLLLILIQQQSMIFARKIMPAEVGSDY